MQVQCTGPMVVGKGERGGVKVCAHTTRGHVVMLHGTRSCGKVIRTERLKIVLKNKKVYKLLFPIPPSLLPRPLPGYTRKDLAFRREGWGASAGVGGGV